MKIAVLTKFAEYPGGVETVTRLLQKTFQEKGHSVDILSWDLFPSSALLQAKRIFWGEEELFSRLINPYVDQYDLLICNGEFGYKIKHPNAVCLFHGSDKGYLEHLSAFMRPWHRRIYKKKAQVQKKAALGKAVVVVSSFIQKILEEEGIAVDHVVENGIDLTCFYPQENKKEKEALFVGTYDYYGKGFDVLEAIAEKGVLIDCVTSLAPKAPLKWVPQRSYAQMPKVYSLYKYFLFPSRFEGMSMAPLEAMACGVPVVISKVGLGEKLQKFIPDFVANTLEGEEFLEKMEKISSNYDVYCQKARAYVEEHHSIELFKKKWWSILEESTTQGKAVGI